MAARGLRLGSELQLAAYQRRLKEQNVKATREARLIPGVVGEANAGEEPAYWGRVRVLCAAHKLPLPDSEYRFAPPRRWRFDYSWISHLIAVEIEGGLFVQGRHTTGAGMRADMEKYNHAAILGWRVLRYLPEQLDAAFDDVAALMR